MPKVITVFLVSVATCLVSIGLMLCVPQNTRVLEIDNALDKSEIATYFELDRLGLYDRDKLTQLRDEQAEIEKIRDKAQTLWDSIPAGEVVGVRGAGYYPVGKAKEVRDLRERANRLQVDLHNKRRVVALSEGHRLATTPSRAIWEEHEQLKKDLEIIYSSHSWFYGSWLRFLPRICYVVFIIAGLVAAVCVLVVLYGDC